jgi:hypothetical protein
MTRASSPSQHCMPRAPLFAPWDDGRRAHAQVPAAVAGGCVAETHCRSCG